MTTEQLEMELNKYIPGPYKVLEGLKTQIKAKKELVGQQSNEVQRAIKAVEETTNMISELESAVQVLEANI